MQINRQSYEEYFLLYADGELNESEKKAVEEFISHNPDLAIEFSLIQETVMKPDGSIIFENRELLFKDEKEESNVVYMRWFRIAAAAVLFIAFSVIGWVFLADKNIRKQPLVVVKSPEVKKTVIPDAPSPGETEGTPAEKNPHADKDGRPEPAPGNHLIARSEKYEKIKHQNRITEQATERFNNPQIINGPDVVQSEPKEKNAEGTALRQDIVKTDPAREVIDVQVEPRVMEKPAGEIPGSNNAYYAQSFRQESENDMIYFANTSLTKKTKLRGVLRKASRYLDRVTSLQ